MTSSTPLPPTDPPNDDTCKRRLIGYDPVDHGELDVREHEWRQLFRPSAYDGGMSADGFYCIHCLATTSGSLS